MNFPTCPQITACGILPREDRIKKRVIVEAGRDLTSVFLFENNGITDYRVCLTGDRGPDEIGIHAAQMARELMKRSEGAEQFFLAGDLTANDSLERVLENELGIPVRRSSPLGVETLSRPRDAGIVGLLHVADELERKNPAFHTKKHLFSTMRDRAVSYINEYF